MKKQLIVLGTMFVLALGALPSMAGCPCQSNYYTSPQACPCAPACPACPCQELKPCCPAIPCPAAPCCPILKANPCCGAMPCPAAPVCPCASPYSCPYSHTNCDLCD